MLNTNGLDMRGATQNVLCTDVLGSLWLARTFSCSLRLSEGNWTWQWQQQGVRGCRFVDVASFVASWVGGVISLPAIYFGQFTEASKGYTCKEGNAKKSYSLNNLSAQIDHSVTILMAFCSCCMVSDHPRLHLHSHMPQANTMSFQNWYDITHIATTFFLQRDQIFVRLNGQPWFP